MEPASSIINRLGGAAKVAKICGVHRTRPWKWTRPREQGGAGGVIPRKHAAKIIKAGHEIGFDIPYSAFLPGIEGEE